MDRPAFPVTPRYAGAFTLVEMAIVIVIIGLIVGGILVGTDLVRVGEARKIMRQMDSYSTAVNTFRLKYNCLPGDCAQASAYGVGNNGNGNGGIGLTGNNGLVDGSTTDLTFAAGTAGSPPHIYHYFGEFSQFWVQLATAGMIEGSYTNSPWATLSAAMDLYFPKDALGKAYMVAFTWNGSTYIRTGITGTDSQAGPYSNINVLYGSHLQYMTDKLGQKIWVEPGYAGCSYKYCGANPTVKVAGLSIVHALGGGAEYFVLPGINANTNSGGGGMPSCVTTSGGGFTYNSTAECNLLWKLDF